METYKKVKIIMSQKIKAKIKNEIEYKDSYQSIFSLWDSLEFYRI